MLFVHDIEKVAAFYETYFGLKRMGTVKDGYLELKSTGTRIALHRAGKLRGSITSSRVKIVFACSDVKKQVEAFKKQGLQFGKVYEWEGISFADTKDPEKNPVQISSRK